MISNFTGVTGGAGGGGGQSVLGGGDNAGGGAGGVVHLYKQVYNGSLHLQIVS